MIPIIPAAPVPATATWDAETGSVVIETLAGPAHLTVADARQFGRELFAAVFAAEEDRQ